MKNLYIADWHYGHKNILALDNRPFKSVEEMNQTLIDNWNAEVCDDDTVYVLGDMFWCKPGEAVPILKQLKGKKILIKGNHDRVGNSEFDKCFEKITDYLEIKDCGRKIVLCHYPIPCFNKHFSNWYHLYGHVHDSFEHKMMLHDKFLMEELYGCPCQMYNVGAMMPYMSYTPRTLEAITQGFYEYNSSRKEEV